MRGLEEIVKDNNNAHKAATAPRTLANATSAALLAEVHAYKAHANDNKAPVEDTVEII
jgi:hypothetical protein